MLEESWALANMFNPVAFCMRLPISGVCNSVGLPSIFGVLFINICFSFYFLFIRHYFILHSVMLGSLTANYTVSVLFVVQGRSSMSFGLWLIVVSLGLFPYMLVLKKAFPSCIHLYLILLRMFFFLMKFVWIWNREETNIHCRYLI